MIQNIIIWIIIGVWVSYKRDWYDKQEYEEPPSLVYILMSVVLGPVALLIAFFREMVFKKWDNEN
jgi:uncharacterized membrane protein